MNNVLIAYEIIYSMNSQPQGNNCYMALKLDMNKACDRVKWSFLKAVMTKMGFHPNWIKLITFCVCSGSYYILVNGDLQPRFKPFRDIRQGDTLSLYFFHYMC